VECRSFGRGTSAQSLSRRALGKSCRFADESLLFSAGIGADAKFEIVVAARLLLLRASLRRVLRD